MEAMAVREDKQMTINYFEFLVLVEASWYVGTILRHSIMVKAIDVWYHALSKNNRQKAFEYFTRHNACTEETHHRFMARYNPECQYRITLVNGSQKDIVECYMFNNEYWNSSFQCCNKDFITHIAAI